MSLKLKYGDIMENFETKEMLQQNKEGKGCLIWLAIAIVFWITLGILIL